MDVGDSSSDGRGRAAFTAGPRPDLAVGPDGKRGDVTGVGRNESERAMAFIASIGHGLSGWEPRRQPSVAEG